MALRADIRRHLGITLDDAIKSMYLGELVEHVWIWNHDPSTSIGYINQGYKYPINSSDIWSIIAINDQRMINSGKGQKPKLIELPMREKTDNNNEVSISKDKEIISVKGIAKGKTQEDVFDILAKMNVVSSE